jgi:hypothetical protein
MFLEGLLEFSPRDLMSSGNHGLEVLPPYQCCTTELEGSETGLTLLLAGQGEHIELGLNVRTMCGSKTGGWLLPCVMSA